MTKTAFARREILRTHAFAGATLLLLFAGIYGAWDLTLWMIKNREKT